MGLFFQLSSCMRIAAKWNDGELDSSVPPLIEEAYFDETLAAWVLSRYEDVLAAFRSSSLIPSGPRSKNKQENAAGEKQSKMRAEAADALSAPVIAGWGSQARQAASAILEKLPASRAIDLAASRAIDLVAEYARPLCLAMAVEVTRPSGANLDRLPQLAEQVSAGAAEPFDSERAKRAKEADAEMRSYFHAGPAALRESGYVGLSITLSHLLARCWFALVQHPREWNALHTRPMLVGSAVEELLRYAGLTRILFRMANSDVQVNGKLIRRGDRVILRVAAADRDPTAFSNPEALNLQAQQKPQLALGFGSHACVGAPLIKLVMSTSTQALVERYATAELAREVEWLGGSGFRFPKSLNVWLR